MSVRESYAARFGEDQAEIIEQASSRHLGTAASDLHSNDNRGSDPFRYHLLNVIAYECVEKYAKLHKITVPHDEFKDWCVQEAGLDQHDGDIPDYLALAVGMYNEYMPKPDA